MTKEYKESGKIRYHLEVEHSSGEFDEDMDYLTYNPLDACKRLQNLKQKYFDRKIKITKIIETKTFKPISEKDLLETKIRDFI